MKEKRKVNELLLNGQHLCCNGTNIEVLCFLGKGRGGYSYLVLYGGKKMVLKKYHYEPCEVYTFEKNKLEAELRDYKKLAGLHIPMPVLVDINYEEQYIIKEYIEGPTLAELIAEGKLSFRYYLQMRELCKILYKARLNIDYMPQNFVARDGRFFYIDFERNPYSNEWDFEHWGIYFWVNRSGMKKYIKTLDHKYLSKMGKPLHTPANDLKAKLILFILHFV